MVTDNFPHDAAYKTFFSNPDMVRSLLLDFVPEEFIRSCDLSTLEKVSGEYITEDLRQRAGDLVWRVKWRGSWCYIYILLEFQSSQDYWMALRVLSYTALLWEELIKQCRLKAGEKLPPVFPIVIYNGETVWKCATDISDLISPLDESLMMWQPRQKYFLLDENRMPPRLLAGAKGLSACIFRLEQAETAEEMRSISHELARRLKEPEFEFLRRAIYSWISRLIVKRSGGSPEERADDVEDVIMLEKRIARWEQELLLKGRQEGRAEGRQEGREENKKESILQQKQLLLEMLNMRFGEFPLTWKETVESLTEIEKINQLMLALWRVKTADEFNDLLINRQDIF